MRNKRGFTLVELLTVMGVIVVLIALLFPVLGRAREYSNRVKCSADLKQILQACDQYCVDNDGYLPQPNCVNKKPFPTATPADGPTGWLYRPDPNAATIGSPPMPVVDDSLVETGTLWPYIKNRSVYRCPMLEPALPGQFTKNLTSYVMNEGVVGFFPLPATDPRGPTPDRGLSYRRSQLAPHTVLLWECGSGEPQNSGFQNPSNWNDGCDQPQEGLTARHAGGGQVAYLDGSVSYMTAVEFLAEQQVGSLHFRDFFCRPDTRTGE